MSVIKKCVSVKEKGVQVHRLTDLASKRAWIAEFCDTLSGFADLENTADHGLAENFDQDSRLFMSGSSDCV